MSDSLRYKIVLWMVWVQIALLPIIIVMINVTNSGVMWRWNLINNLLVVGYIHGHSPNKCDKDVSHQNI